MNYIYKYYKYKIKYHNKIYNQLGSSSQSTPPDFKTIFATQPSISFINEINYCVFNKGRLNVEETQLQQDKDINFTQYDKMKPNYYLDEIKYILKSSIDHILLDTVDKSIIDTIYDEIKNIKYNTITELKLNIKNIIIQYEQYFNKYFCTIMSDGCKNDDILNFSSTYVNLNIIDGQIIIPQDINIIDFISSNKHYTQCHSINTNPISSSTNVLSRLIHNIFDFQIATQSGIHGIISEYLAFLINLCSVDYFHTNKLNIIIIDAIFNDLDKDYEYLIQNNSLYLKIIFIIKNILYDNFVKFKKKNLIVSKHIMRLLFENSTTYVPFYRIDNNNPTIDTLKINNISLLGKRWPPDILCKKTFCKYDFQNEILINDVLDTINYYLNKFLNTNPDDIKTIIDRVKINQVKINTIQGYIDYKINSLELEQKCEYILNKNKDIPIELICNWCNKSGSSLNPLYEWKNNCDPEYSFHWKIASILIGHENCPD